MNQLALGLLLSFGGMLVLMILENLPAQVPVPSGLQIKRWTKNWTLAILNFLVVSVLLNQFLTFPSIAQVYGFGERNPVFDFILCLFVYELLSYTAHMAFHKVGFLWRFHAVHHSDQQLDATTSHRHHTVEAVLMYFLFVAAQLLFGFSSLSLLIYVIFRTAIAIFSHTSLKLPVVLDKWLSKIIVTPDFHHNHHSSVRQLADSNYSTSLSLFDYAFRTATVPARYSGSTINYGKRGDG